MKGGTATDDDETSDNGAASDDWIYQLFGGIEWRTGTHLDRYTPIYRLLLSKGISTHDADHMDLTMVALLCGKGARPADGERDELPGGIKAPSWWRGNKAAFNTSMRAQRQMAGQQGSG